MHTTNAYRKGAGTKTELVWDDRAGKLSSRTALPTGQDAAKLVQIVSEHAQ